MDGPSDPSLDKMQKKKKTTEIAAYSIDIV